MKIEWAIPCRFAEINEQNCLTIVSGAHSLVLSARQEMLPFTLERSVVVSMLWEDGESDVRTLRHRVLDPDLKEIASGRRRVGREEEDDGLPDPLPRTMAVLTVTFGVDRPGTYSIELDVDGRAARSLPIHVALKPV